MPRPATAAEVVDEVGRLATAEPDRTVFVGIDGFGAAGKTTLAAQVAVAYPRAVVVHVDDFSGPQIREWDWTRFEAQVAAPLRAGCEARYEIRGWDSDTGGRWTTVQPGALLVVEGVSCTRVEVALEWDLTVWVSAPREVRLRRAVERDGPAMLDTWLTRWMPPEEAYAQRERPQQRADLIVDGRSHDEVLGQSIL